MTKNSKAMSRKAQGEETRATLVSVGARLFAQNGYDGVSMRTLAAEAEVNLATVGYHFGGKAGLYEAILQDLIDSRDELFPTLEEVEEKGNEAGDDPHARGEVVDWFITRLAHGMLGHEHDHWPIFIISRELAQPSDLYPKLDEEFFQPAMESMFVFTSYMIPECDKEERIIVGHAIIGMLTKFLEGCNFIVPRLGWESYEGRGMDKITAVLTKRFRGFLGLPMEKK